MALIVDLIVAAILIYFFIYGYKKGFAITVVNTFSYVLSIIITACTYKKITEYVASSPFGVFISEKINTALVESFAKKTDVLISDLNLPEILKAGVAESTFVQDSTAILASNITNAIITLLTVVLLFIAIRFLLVVLKGPLKAITSLPLIKEINKILGALVGSFAGCFWVFVILAVIGMLSFVPGIDFIAELINKTYIAKAIYDNNLLFFIMK